MHNNQFINAIKTLSQIVLASVRFNFSHCSLMRSLHLSPVSLWCHHCRRHISRLLSSCLLQHGAVSYSLRFSASSACRTICFFCIIYRLSSLCSSFASQLHFFSQLRVSFQQFHQMRKFSVLHQVCSADLRSCERLFDECIFDECRSTIQQISNNVLLKELLLYNGIDNYN